MALSIDVYVYRVIPASPPSPSSLWTFDDVAHENIPVANIASTEEINSIFGTDLPGLPFIYGKIIWSQGQNANANLREAYVMNNVASLLAKMNA